MTPDEVRQHLMQMVDHLKQRFGMKVLKAEPHPLQANAVRIQIDAKNGLSIDLLPLDVSLDAVLQDPTRLRAWADSVMARAATPQLVFRKLQEAAQRVNLSALAGDLSRTAPTTDNLVRLINKYAKQHHNEILAFMQQYPLMGSLVVTRDGSAAGSLRAVIKLHDVVKGHAALDEEVSQLIWRFMTPDERRQVLDHYATPVQRVYLKGKALNSRIAEEIGAQALMGMEGRIRLKQREYAPSLLHRVIAALLRLLPFARAWAKSKADALLQMPVIPGGKLLEMIRDGSIYDRPYTPLLEESGQTAEAYAVRRERPPPSKTKIVYRLMWRDPKTGALRNLYAPPGTNPTFELGVWYDAQDLTDPATGRYVAGPPKWSGRKSDIAAKPRPGFHAIEAGPTAQHIGIQDPVTKKPAYRDPNQVWVEAEVSADIDYNEQVQRNAQRRADGSIDMKTADMRDVPVDGYYYYTTNPHADPRMRWIIAGAMKINRILSDEEVARINTERGLPPDLPRPPRGAEAFSVSQSAPDIYQPSELLEASRQKVPPITVFGNEEIPRDPTAGFARLIKQARERLQQLQDDEARKAGEQVPKRTESVEEWIQEAHEILRDPQRFQRLFEKVDREEVLTPGEQRALLEATAARFQDALTMADDRAAASAMADAARLAEYYNQAGTEAGRALRSRWADLDTVEGRGRWLNAITFRMSKRWRDKIKAAKTKDERDRLREQWARKRAELYRRVLNNYGIDLLDPTLPQQLSKGEVYATARMLAEEAALIGADPPDIGDAWWRLWPSYVTGNLISLAGLAANLTGAAIFKFKNTLREMLIDPALAKAIGHQKATDVYAANAAAMASWFSITSLSTNRLGRGWMHGRWLSEDISENPSIGETMAASEGRRDPWAVIGEDLGRRIGGEKGAVRGRTTGTVLRALLGPAREGVIVLDEFLWQHTFTREVLRQLSMRGTVIDLDRLPELLDNAPEDIVRIAVEKADMMTLRNRPVTEVFRGINGILDAVTMAKSFYGSDSVAAKLWHGVASTILPFRRALVNLSEHAVRIADPTQAIKGALAIRKARKAMRGDIEEDASALARKASEHFANALLGVGVYTIAAFIEAPLTLEEQSEPMRRRTLETARQTRELPGGIAISRLEPISPAVLTAKATAHIIHDWEKHDLETAVAKYLSRIANVNLNRTLMTGISSLMGKEFDDVTGEPKSFLLKLMENMSDVAAPGRPYIVSTRMLTDEKPKTAVDTGAFGVTYGPRKPARNFFGQEAEFRHQNPLVRLFLGGHRAEDPEAIKWARRLDQANEELIAHRRTLTPEERDKLINPWDIPYFARTIRRNNKKYVMNEEEYEQAKSILGEEVRRNLQRLEETGRWRDDADMLTKIKLIRGAVLKAHATARRHGLRMVRARMGGGQAALGPEFDIPTVDIPNIDMPELSMALE